MSGWFGVAEWKLLAGLAGLSIGRCGEWVNPALKPAPSQFALLHSSEPLTPAMVTGKLRAGASGRKAKVVKAFRSVAAGRASVTAAHLVVPTAMRCR